MRREEEGEKKEGGEETEGQRLNFVKWRKKREKTAVTEHLLCTALPPNSVNLTQALKSSAFCIFVTGEPLKAATPSAIPQMASQGHEDLL